MASTVEDPLSASSAAPHNDGNSQRFRFKRKHDRRDVDGRHKEADRDRRSHRHNHHRKRRKTSSGPIDDPSAYDDSVPELPPDVAFRESLFDAMGDDEGAAFWEGVYGQPIHTMPNTYRNEETGELEQMNDEEYAQFVRRKMWEKSWEGIEAAKEERRKERRSERQKVREGMKAETRPTDIREEPDYLFDLDIERSLRRGEQRKARQHWKLLWNDYLQRWADLQALRDTYKPTEGSAHLYLRNVIAWPVESGKRKDVSAEEISRFIKQCIDSLDNGTETMSHILRTERIRWHPDKIQQRYGLLEIDESTMQGVTATFQVLDRMWNDTRSGKGVSTGL